MKNFGPARHALLTMRLIIFTISLILLGLVKVYIPIDIVVIVAALAVGTVDIFLIFVYMPLYFGSLSFESTEDAITKHCGVIFKSHQSIRYSTVQYTTIISTPFSKLTGLNFVILFVYGGQLRLMFLSEEDALFVMKRAGESIDLDGGSPDE